MPTVLVLLSTYNGSEFIREQLDSVYRQEGVSVYVLARDDGSSDNTREILEEYQRNIGKMTLLFGENIGAARSFYELMIIAETDYSGYDYYAFCDQDDVWLNNKLKDSIYSLQKSNSVYRLFYSSAYITDRSLRVSGSTKHIINTFDANVISNRSLGCTQLFNFPLLRVCNRIQQFINNEDYLIMHDAWVALTAYSINAEVIYSEIPLIYYRQHGGNVVGAERNLIKIAINRAKRNLCKANLKSRKALWVLRTMPDLIDENKKRKLEEISSYRKGFRRFRLLFRKSMYQNDLLSNVGLFFLILIGRF